jgi:ABC-type uncharacterized transport system permease subunit
VSSSMYIYYMYISDVAYSHGRKILSLLSHFFLRNAFFFRSIPLGILMVLDAQDMLQSDFLARKAFVSHTRRR